MSERDEFEAWRENCGYNTESFKGVLWLCWKAARAAPWQASETKEVSDRELFEQWSKDHGWDAGIAFRYVPRDADAYEYHLEMACRWEGFRSGRSFIAGRAFITKPVVPALRRLIAAVERVDACFDEAGSVLSDAISEQEAALADARAALAAAQQPSQKETK